MKIGILGTRGVPNHHGGFEQFAEYFSVYLVQNGHKVYVYNSSNHPYKERFFNGVNVIHCFDPEDKIGTSGQFIYDLNCILDSRKRQFDIILQLGYTSSSIWHNLLPKKPVIITNMDGLEWKRSKYSKWVQKFLKYAEKQAVNSSDYLVSDSLGIQKYLQEKYNIDSEYIAYGAKPFDNPTPDILDTYNLEPHQYNMLVARLEPENNIEVILDGVVIAKNKMPFIIVGKHDVNRFGQYLKDKYRNNHNIIFLGGIYNLEYLNNLRYFSNLYFHGHSVGGTNPSLLEAMASKALIVAHENEFNVSILKDNAFYFNTCSDVAKHINTIRRSETLEKINNAFKDIEINYSWSVINKKYLDFFDKCLNRNE